MGISIIIKPGDPDYYRDAKFERTGTAGGTIIVDGQEVASTLQCVHCGGHWVSMVGSGIKRGWCGNCAGPVCGEEQCMKHCVPMEKMIEQIERKAYRQREY